MGIGAKRLRGRTGFGAKRPGTSPIESGGLILVYMYICILMMYSCGIGCFFLYISYNFQQNKY
jgi:hypothetical protein